MANHRGPIPEWLTTNYVEDVLQKSFKDETLLVDYVDISPGSQVGDNYVCQIYRIKADIVKNGKKEKLSIIGKYNRPTAILEDFGAAMDVFRVEAVFFDKLVPLMDKEITKYVPKCYHIDTKNSIFFMNDLIEDNYEMHPRNTTLSKDQAKLVLEALAVFHASTYKANQSDPTLKEVFPPTIWKKDLPQPMKCMLRNAHKMVLKALPFYELPKELEDVLKDCIHRMEEEWCQICEFKEDRLNVLVHGDCWKNNILFRYKDNKVESAKLLDFQIINYNSFANDLLYFLFSSVNADVLVSDLDELLELYYNKLSSSAPEIPNLTLERVKEEFAERYYFGFLNLMFFRPVHYGDTPPDLDEIVKGVDCEMGFLTANCREDFRKLMPFFYDRGVFDKK